MGSHMRPRARLVNRRSRRSSRTTTPVALVPVLVAEQLLHDPADHDRLDQTSDHILKFPVEVSLDNITAITSLAFR